MSQTDVRILVRAEVQQAISEMRKTGEAAKTTAQDIESSGRQMRSSFMETVGTAQNVANSMIAMYHTVDNVQKANLALDRANLRVSNSLDTVAKAQNNYNGAIEKFGAGSPEAIDALKQLDDAQEKLRIDQETAAQRQQDLNERIVFGAVTAIPQAIAMVKNLKDLYGLLTAASAAHTVALGTETTAQIGLNTARLAGLAAGAGVALGVGAAAGLIIAGYAQAGEWAKENWTAEDWEQYAKTTSRAGVLPGYAKGGLVGLGGPEKVIVGEHGPEWVIPANPFQPLGLTPVQPGQGYKTLEEYAKQQPYDPKTMTGSWMVQVPQGFKQPEIETGGWADISSAPALLAQFAAAQKAAPTPAVKPATKMAPMAVPDYYSQPYPSQIEPQVSGKGDIIIKEIKVEIRDVSIDAATYARFKREMAYNIANQVCDAIQEQRSL